VNSERDLSTLIGPHLPVSRAGLVERETPAPLLESSALRFRAARQDTTGRPAVQRRQILEGKF